MHQQTIHISTPGRGLHSITSQVHDVVASSGIHVGVCNVFLRHTSASLVIQENADPDVRHDLEAFFARLVPDGDSLYRHTDEGPDDMPSHVRTALTASTLSIPISGGALGLGTWQGIYLWEHRIRPHDRQIIITLVGQ